MLHLEFNSDSENEGIARIVTAAYIMKFDPDMEEMDDIKTAVSEAVTNCIVHAYHNPDGKISMDLSDQNGILRIEIKDQGIGIPDVKKAMEPMFTTKPEEERTGMGFSTLPAPTVTLFPSVISPRIMTLAPSSTPLPMCGHAMLSAPRLPIVTP